MPGIVLNPIANFGFGQGVQPYIPTYDSVYVASWQLYQVSGSTTGGTQGGIAKMDFSGSVSTSWMASANTAATGSQLSVRFAQGARDYVLADARNTVTGTDYREVRLIDKSTGTIVSSSGNYADSGGSVFGMSTDTEENNVYVFGSYPVFPSGSTIQQQNGLCRVPHSSIIPDQQFRTNIGDGPVITGTPKIVTDVHVNPYGKIGVCHNGTNWDNNTNKYHNFVVLNNDGTVDTSFDFGSAQFKQYGSTVANGALKTCHWFEVGSLKVWVVGGLFDSFGSSADSGSYQKMMAFNEDGSINTDFTNNFKEGDSSNNLNADVLDITNDDLSPSYGLVMGNFTQRGSLYTANKVLAIDGQGYPQIFGSGTKSNIKAGVVHNNQLYYLYDGTSTQDQSGTTVNVDGMYALNVYDFNHTPYFDIGAGLEQNGGAYAEPGSIFLG